MCFSTVDKCLEVEEDDSTNQDYIIGSYRDGSGQIWFLNKGATKKEGRFARCFPEKFPTGYFG